MPKRTPQSPDYFGTLYPEVIEAAFERGYHSIECSSNNEAQCLKFSFYRFFRSMQYYLPDDPITAKCSKFKVRVKDDLVELVLREKDPMNESLEKSLHKEARRIDPIADSVRSIETEFEELRRLEAEGKLLPPDTNQD